jgi:aspartate-semialdehyde dehydrogenase
VKVAAVVEPGSLLAKELRERLDQRPDLVGEQRLLTTVEEEVGTLTESTGAAAIVGRLTAEALEGVDLLFLCGPMTSSREALAASRPGLRTVLLSPDATTADAPPFVAGVNLDVEGGTAAPRPGPLVLSPHPGAVLLAHLLHPLRGLGLRRAEATLLQPVSIYSTDALDKLFEQARSLLTFQPVVPSPYWSRQLAFNLVASEGTGDVVREQAEAVLGGQVAVSAQVVQAGVFHGFAASVHLAFEPAPELAALRDAYADRPFLRWAEEDPLGPTDTASADDVLLGHLRADPGRPGSCWLWSVMDNLTRGGASNALALAEALLQGA